jgi:hypothetical protein
MWLYGKKHIRKALNKATRSTSETKDAIVWDVLLVDKVCRVKIQGSDNLVYAKFPTNWNEIPSWLKKGQAVRIIHRGGKHGFIEVAGYGQAVPTPVAGNQFPPASVPENIIVSGLEIRAIPINPRMMVYISNGSVRFNGVTTNVPSVSMANGGIITADMGLLLGSVTWIGEIAAPEDEDFRYDAFSVSSTGVITRTVGNEFSSVESKPTIPSGDLLIGYLLVRKGQTEITTEDIAVAWTVPEASKVVFLITNPSTDVYDIKVSVLDQYGNAITITNGWDISISLDGGDGTLDALSKNSGELNYCTFTFTKGTATILMFGVSVVKGEVNLSSAISIEIV